MLGTGGVNMEMIRWLANHINEIVCCIWSLLLILNMYSNHKNEQSNKEVTDIIKEVNDLDNKMLNEVREYAKSADKKFTAQDNLMWNSIVIDNTANEYFISVCRDGIWGDDFYPLMQSLM